MEFLTCILCFCISFFFISKLKSKTTIPSKLPPGPKPLPVIGNLLDLGEKPHKSLAAMAKEHGPVMSLKLGRLTAVVVSSSAMAKEILQTNDQVLCNRTVPDAVKAHNHDDVGFAWIPVSPLWRNYRKICNNTLFAGKALDANENLRRRKVEELVEIVRKSAINGEAVDVGRLVLVTALNLLSNTIFSVDLADPNSELAREFKNSERKIMEEAGKPNLSDYFPVTEADIPRLPYLQAVVKEALRLHPVVPLLLPRKAEQEVEIGGFTVPKNAQVLVNAWAIGRDPRIWLNPESFEPERFLGSESDVMWRSFEAIPFGGGRRICPGLPLAMRMLHLILGSLIGLFDWKVEDGFEVDMDDKFGVTVEMAHPLRAIPSPVI